MRLVIYSKSTEQYIDDFYYDEKLCVTKQPSSDILKDLIKYSNYNVIAIGGGSVIDTAKIISNKRITAVPTTYSGASQTSHAVMWDFGKKINIKTKKPKLLLKREYFKTLKRDAETYSKIDCLCHVMESVISPNATIKSKYYTKKAINCIHNNNWIDASIYAGNAIEITGTNVLHGLSYPLTEKYGIPHGKALATILHNALNIPKVRELL